MKIAVLGNAVVDCLARVPDVVLEKFKLTKGDSVSLDVAQYLELIAQVPGETFKSGGSSANMAWTLARLGNQVTFLGQTGTDAAGRHFMDDMLQAGVAMPADPLANQRTMEVFVLITPDGARTLVQPRLPEPDESDVWVDEKAVEQADWLAISCYTLHSHPAAVRFAVSVARKHKVKIVVLLGSPRAVQNGLPLLTEVLLGGVQLVIGNQGEYALFPESVLADVPHIITRSSKGATFYQPGQEPVKVAVAELDRPQDRTGAGDAFASGVLAAWNGSNPEEALRRGHQLARACLQHMGARVPDPRAAWNGTLGLHAA